MIFSLLWLILEMYLLVSFVFMGYVIFVTPEFRESELNVWAKLFFWLGSPLCFAMMIWDIFVVDERL